MAILPYEFDDTQRETCAVLNMRDAVAKLSEQQNIPYEDALMLFTDSVVYNALFDFETGVWRESPEYLLSLWNNIQIKKQLTKEAILCL